MHSTLQSKSDIVMKPKNYLHLSLNNLYIIHMGESISHPITKSCLKLSRELMKSKH